ncbi:hypothetical protein PIB30_027170 [Stylosanthes scabra]|uniref:Uncharacterized protein n=1 Tax=Stylosanthes scabra TaxID=79078 RepID=A0ABU6QA24_9FABA|nr:hypothetical protein [Stylosanthes scabra]
MNYTLDVEVELGPHLLVLYCEIERTLRHIRQVRRQIQFGSGSHSQAEELASDQDLKTRLGPGQIGANFGPASLRLGQSRSIIKWPG